MEGPGHLPCQGQVLLTQQCKAAKVPGLLSLWEVASAGAMEQPGAAQEQRKRHGKRTEGTTIATKACSSCTGSTSLWWVMSINGRAGS